MAYEISSHLQFKICNNNILGYSKKLLNLQDYSCSDRQQLHVQIMLPSLQKKIEFNIYAEATDRWSLIYQKKLNKEQIVS